MSRLQFFYAFIFVLAFPVSAHAYIGPGLGAGTLAVVAGFVVAIFLAIFGILWYPLKRLFNRFKARNSKAN